MATSTGCLALIGFPATASASLVVTGVPSPRHSLPAGFLVSGLKGSRLAAVAMAAGTAVPGPLYLENDRNISSCPAGRFAGVQLPRHAGLLVSSMKGGRLEVVPLAAGAAIPGGSDHDRPLYCQAANNISSSPAGRFSVHGASGVYSLTAGVPNSKCGRLAVVVRAGATSPGESDDGMTSEDCQAAVSAFRLEMELFKFSQRPVALVGSPTDILMDGAFDTAKECTEIVEFLLAKVSVNKDTLKELITIGQAFLTVESQAKEGYLKADALANVIQGLKVVGKTFFQGVNFPDYFAPMVPLSSDDVDKDSFFMELVNIFIVLYTAVYTEACKKYGFSKGGAN